MQRSSSGRAVSRCAKKGKNGLITRYYGWKNINPLSVIVKVDMLIPKDLALNPDVRYSQSLGWSRSISSSSVIESVYRYYRRKVLANIKDSVRECVGVLYKEGTG